MGELSQPAPGTHCEVPRDTIVYRLDLVIEQDATYQEACRTSHRTMVLIVGTATSLSMVHWSLCLVSTDSGGMLGWIYNRNLRTPQ